MRVLLVPAAGGVGLGPLTNVLAIAEELTRAHHEVGILCKDRWLGAVDDRNIQIYLTPTPSPYSGPKPPPYRLSDVVIGLGWAEENFIRASIEAERRAIVSFQADLVVTMLQLTAPISAAIEGVPCAAITSWADGPDFRSPLYEPQQTLQGYEKSYNDVLREYHLDPITDVCELAFLRSQIRVAPTSPDLQPELQSVPNVHFVGYLLASGMEVGQLPDEIADLREKGPLVYAYLTPGDIKPSYWIPALIEAFEDSEFQVVVTLAPLGVALGYLPDSRNVHFYDHLPGTTVISHSDIVITHGGANTVINALLSGVPLMVFPDVYAERDYNGRAVARLGAGVNLPTAQLTPRLVRGYAQRITSDPSYKLRATRIGEGIRKLGGSRRVVDVLESALA